MACQKTCHNRKAESQDQELIQDKTYYNPRNNGWRQKYGSQKLFSADS